MHRILPSIFLLLALLGKSYHALSQALPRYCTNAEIHDLTPAPSGTDPNLVCGASTVELKVDITPVLGAVTYYWADFRPVSLYGGQEIAITNSDWIMDLPVSRTYNTPSGPQVDKPSYQFRVERTDLGCTTRWIERQFVVLQPPVVNLPLTVFHCNNSPTQISCPLLGYPSYADLRYHFYNAMGQELGVVQQGGSFPISSSQPSAVISAKVIADQCTSSTVSINIREETIESPQLIQGRLADDHVYVTNRSANDNIWYQWYNDANAASEPLQTADAFEPSRTGNVYVRGFNSSTGCVTGLVSFDVERVNNINYVIGNRANDSLITNLIDLSQADVGPVTQETTYFNLLGDKDQVTQTAATPSGADLVFQTIYDSYRRPFYEYLAVPNSNANPGYYIDRNDFNTAREAYYHIAFATDGGSANDDYSWKETLYESSPGNRVTEIRGPGGEWRMNNKSIVYSYEFYETKIPVYSYNYAEKKAIWNSSNYPSTAFTVTKVTDEDGLQSMVFKDAQSRVILSKSLDQNEDYATYNIYDSKGQLRFVVPPLGYKKLLLNKPSKIGYGPTYEIYYSVAYDYDAKGRIIGKYVSGAGSTSYVYDQSNRLICEQTPLQNSRHIWQFYKYDMYGRKVMEGYSLGDFRVRAELQTAADQQVASEYFEYRIDQFPYYTTSTSPSVPNIQINIWYFFDTYELDGQAYPYTNSTGGDDLSTRLLTSTRDKMTLKLVRNTDNSILATAFFYDQYGRQIQTYVRDITDGENITTSLLKFNGIPSSVQHHHNSNYLNNYTFIEKYEYDVAWRILSFSHGNKLLSKYSYSETGKLLNKTFGAQSVNFQYNIRGWQTQINDPISLGSDLFAEKICYLPSDLDDLPNSSGYYNGKPKSIIWADGGNDFQHSYSYSYDEHDRLSYASYFRRDKAYTGGWQDQGLYDEGASYDPNGNINELQRNGVISYSPLAYGILDHLNYTYSANRNRLISVDNTFSNSIHDADVQLRHFRDFGSVHYSGSDPDEYLYEEGGFLKQDLNAGNRTYTCSDAGYLLTCSNAVNGNVYSSVRSFEGERLTEKFTAGNTSLGSTTCGSIVFEGKNPAAPSKLTPTYAHLEGYVELESCGKDWKPHYYYYMRDHLGSIRAVFEDGDVQEPCTSDPSDGNSSYRANRHETATMELSAAAVEDTLYPGTALSRAYAPAQAYSGQYVASLGGARRWGPGRSLRVSRGDSIEATVFAYAPQQNPTKRKFSKWLLGFVPFAGIVQSQERSIKHIPLPNLVLSLPIVPSLARQASNAGGGKLNWVFFNKDSVLTESGSMALSVYGDWQKIFAAMVAKEDGYIYVYLTDDGGEPTLFDEFGVTYKSRDREFRSYYPFGREISELGYKSANWTSGRYGFTGKRDMDWANLPFQDFGARMYDSQLGRWNGIDPLAGKYSSWSPYSYSFDSPVRFADPDGRSVDDYIVDGEGILKRIVKNKLPDRLFMETSSTKIRELKFNDPVNDRKQLRRFSIGQQVVNKVSDKEVNYMMQHAGIRPMGLATRFEFAYTQSQDRMDFGFKYLQPSVGISSTREDNYDGRGGFFMFEGSNKAYNALDGGNFLWGQAAKRIGLSYFTSFVGSEMNELFMDSVEDQQAIKDGYDKKMSTNRSDAGRFYGLPESIVDGEFGTDRGAERTQRRQQK